MEKQRQALEGYERGFHSETSSTPTEFSNPDTISESGSSEDMGKILLLKYPNRVGGRVEGGCKCQPKRCQRNRS